jgi:hypothetical protein
MHELGHTLGLGHGGRIDAVAECGNTKPNYLSVMNYRFQVPNLDPTRPLDFSDAALPTLVESALDEQAGVQGPSGRNVVYNSPAGLRVVPADGAIDWNANGIIDTTPVSVNIDGNSGCGSTIGGTLRGADDWANLAYLFYVAPDFAPGARTTAIDLIDQELHADDALIEAEVTDFDGDGISNADDTCDAVPDATNRDVDQDQIGDACDDDSSATIARVGSSGRVTTNQTIKLVILANPGFSPPTDLVRSTIRFGRTGTEVTGTDCTPTDANRDGRSDLVCSYKLKGSRLQRGTATAFVKARTTWGEPVAGAIALAIS